MRRQVLERLYEAELDHLHELEEKYHAHLDRAVIDLTPQAEKLLADGLFRGLPLARRPISAGCTTRRWRWSAAPATISATPPRGLPDGLEKELCLELAAEEEEHIAMLETEIEQL